MYLSYGMVKKNKQNSFLYVKIIVNGNGPLELGQLGPLDWGNIYRDENDENDDDDDNDENDVMKYN